MNASAHPNRSTVFLCQVAWLHGHGSSLQLRHAQPPGAPTLHGTGVVTAQPLKLDSHDKTLLVFHRIGMMIA